MCYLMMVRDFFVKCVYMEVILCLARVEDFLCWQFTTHSAYDIV